MKLLGFAILTILLVTACSKRACYRTVSEHGKSIGAKAHIAARSWLSINGEEASVSQSNCLLGELGYDPDEITMDFVDSLCSNREGRNALRKATSEIYQRSIYTLRCDCSNNGDSDKRLVIFFFNGAGELQSVVAYSDNVEYKRFLVGTSR